MSQVAIAFRHVSKTFARNGAEVQALKELWVGEKRVARRLPRTVDQGVKECWMWERRTDDIPDAALIGTRWAEYRKEKEAVVATKEMGM